MELITENNCDLLEQQQDLVEGFGSWGWQVGGLGCGSRSQVRRRDIRRYLEHGGSLLLRGLYVVVCNEGLGPRVFLKQSELKVSQSDPGFLSLTHCIPLLTMLYIYI